MSYKLTNKAGEIFYCDAVHFIRLHELAERRGWKPDGGEFDWWLREKMSPLYENEPTSIPVVSSLDAVRMGLRLNGIYMELPEHGDYPRKSPVRGKMTFDVSNRTTTWDELGMYNESQDSRDEYWSHNLDALRDFIHFLFRGSYRIESIRESSPQKQEEENSKKNPNPGLNPKK